VITKAVPNIKKGCLSANLAIAVSSFSLTLLVFIDDWRFGLNKQKETNCQATL